MTSKNGGSRHRPRKDSADRVEAQLAAAITSTSQARRRLSPKHRRFVTLMAGLAPSEADRVASSLGFVRPGRGRELLERLSDLIEAEKVRLKLTEIMSLQEAASIIGEIARDPDPVDVKTKLAAATTIARLHGAFSERMPRHDERELNRQFEEMMSVVKSRLVDPKARLRLKTVEKTLELGGNGGDDPNQDGS